MYESYYNLKLKPFQITTDPKFLWLGEKHTEALATLKYGIMENKGFLLLTGDVGTGKTALINRLVQMIDVAAIVAKIPDPGLSSLDFFNFLAVEFKMNKRFDSKGAFLIYLKNFLHKAYSIHKKVLLIIDEAQRLNYELLEQIRLLSNIELQNRKLINIFFVGQTEFKETLMEDRNRAVRQRIAVSYHIDPLSASESQQYIRHRLKIAGATREIFDQEAIREISTFSSGYPRLINIICDHALLTGYASDLKSINKKVIEECERELQIPIMTNVENNNGQKNAAAKQNPTHEADSEKSSKIKKSGLFVAVVMLLVLGVYLYINQKSGETPRWSMDEIAPQEYQGPTPENSELIAKSKQNDSLEAVPPRNDVTKKIAETNNPKPALDQSEIVESENVAVVTPTEKPNSIERKNSTNLIQQQASSQLNSQAEESIKEEKIASLLNRKFLIYFKHNSNELPDESFETLNQIADFLLYSPTAKVVITGYTDSSGNYTYNVSVSEFRANTIKTYLVGKGVDHKRITARGLGPKDPIASNSTLEGRKKNRRIEIEIK
jgi:general secretion pathway protein A